MGYFETALLTAAVIGALCGLVGVLAVLRRRVFFTQALTHATFPGAVVATALGANVAVGQTIGAVVIVAVMTLIGRVRRQGPQVASGIVLTAGFALGVVLQGTLPALPIRVESFLVGSILTVTGSDLLMATIVLAVAVVVILAFGKEIVFSTFDRPGFIAAGYREWAVDVLVLGLIAAVVVAAMPAVGAILAIALIAAPAAAARLIMPTTTGIFLTAPLIGATSGVVGVLLSREWAVSAGAAIALCAVAAFVIAVAAGWLRGLAWGTRTGGSTTA